MVCRRLLASLSATSHTIQATHSQCHTLLNSYNMARPSLLRCNLLQYRRLMLLHPQVLFPAHCYHAVHSSSQVISDPTRNGTGGVMPLAEAITQLSFLEFLQRCGVSTALPQPSRPLVSISLQDATVQTTPPCDVSQEVSTQTSDQLDTLSCDVAIQTSFYGAPTLSLDAAAQTTSPSTSSQQISTQMGSSSASSFSVDASVQFTAHSAVLLDAATQLDLTEFLIGWIFSDSPIDRRHPFCQSPPSVLGAHVAPLPPPGLEQPTPSPVIATLSQSLTNASSSHCPTLQQTASTTHVGTHPVRPAGAKRSASTAYAGTHNSNGPLPSY